MVSRWKTNPKVIFIYHTKGEKIGRVRQSNTLEEALEQIKEYKAKGFLVSPPAYLS